MTQNQRQDGAFIFCYADRRRESSSPLMRGPATLPPSPRPPPSAGSFQPDELAYWIRRALVTKNGVVACGEQGVVCGPATSAEYRGVEGAVDVRFSRGLVSCKSSDLVRHPAAPLPFGYRLHDTVYFQGSKTAWKDSPRQLESGECGEVCGPATHSSAIGLGVDVYFPGLPQNKRVVSCKQPELRTTPPAGSKAALDAAAAAKAEMREQEAAAKELAAGQRERCREALQEVLQHEACDLESLREAL